MLKINNQSIFAFSDTHGRHRELRVPEGADIVICAGDALEDDLKGGEYDDFLEWFGSVDAKWKFFVPGNHELSFTLGQATAVVERFRKAGIAVLQNTVIDCNGVSICSIGDEVVVADKDIPTGIDVLVTHCPPYGILDEGLGSTEILIFLMKSKPKYHLFGHIHSTEGRQVQFGDTLCVNVGVW